MVPRPRRVTPRVTKCRCSLDSLPHTVLAQDRYLHEQQSAIDQQGDAGARSLLSNTQLSSLITGLTITSDGLETTDPRSPLFTSTEELQRSHISSASPRTSPPDVGEVTRTIHAIIDSDESSPESQSDTDSSLESLSEKPSHASEPPLSPTPSSSVSMDSPPSSTGTENRSDQHRRHAMANQGHWSQQDLPCQQMVRSLGAFPLPTQDVSITKQTGWESRQLEKLEDIEEQVHRAFNALLLHNGTPPLFDMVASLDHAAAEHQRLSGMLHKVSNTLDSVKQKKSEIASMLYRLDGTITRLGSLADQTPRPDLPLNIAQHIEQVDNSSYFLNPARSLGILAQITVVLGIVIHVLFGLSEDQTDWVLSVVKTLATTAISTFRSDPPSRAELLIESQNIESLPKNITQALNSMASLTHEITTHAVCLECKAITSPIYSPRSPAPYYPSHCRNRVVGKEGSSICGAALLEDRQGKMRPKSVYTTASICDYIAREFTNRVVEVHCDTMCDEATSTARGPLPELLRTPFESEFLRTFKGPDGDKLFVDRPGTTARVVYAVHTDYFAPNGLRKRGATESIGVISLVNLALPIEVRYKPEHMFICGIIPGPSEPRLSENSYYMRPIIDEAIQGWKGYRLARTALHRTGRDVQFAFVMSINDLPQARKLAGFPGHKSHRLCTVCALRYRENLYNTDWASWQQHDIDYQREWAYKWLAAETIAERDAIFDLHGVRWSEWWRLPYWNPSRMLVVDGMHCILEGLVHYHCRHVLRHNKPQKSKESPTAFFYPWPAYDALLYMIPQEKSSHIDEIEKIHSLLALPVQGPKSVPSEHIMKRLTRLHLEPLKYVTISLTEVLDLPQNDTRMETASSKKDYAAILLDWRLRKHPLELSADILDRVDNDLRYIQKVIRETTKPSYIDAPPRKYGEFEAGTIKADEWKTLAMIYLPIAYVILWGESVDGRPLTVPSEAISRLDHTMALFQAVIIACRYTIDSPSAEQYRQHLKYWVDNLHHVHPHTRHHPLRPNVHIAFHLYEFFLLFGPLFHWWAFPFERLIGVLQKINTNYIIGGSMETTILVSYLLGSNFRRALCSEKCPPVITEIKTLLDRLYTKARPNTTIDSRDIPYFHHNGVTYSPERVHTGNSVVLFCDSSDPLRLIPGSIEKIWTTGGKTMFLIRSHKPLR